MRARTLFALVFAFLLASACWAQDRVIQTRVGGWTGDGGPAVDAVLNGPGALTRDGAGNLYIAEPHSNRVRKVAPDGTISTFAGTGADGFSGDGGPATAAVVPFPRALGADAADNIYIFAGQRVRRVAPDGSIATVAGGGSQSSWTDGTPATDIDLTHATTMVVGAAGDIYIAASGDVFRVDADGLISRFAGCRETCPMEGNGDGGPALDALVNDLQLLAVDAAGNLYLDGTFRLRKVDAATGIIDTVFGNGEPGALEEGPASAARIAGLYALAVDPADGTLLLAEMGTQTLWRVDLDAGWVHHLAGGSWGVISDAPVGSADELRAIGPWTGVVADTDGKVLFSEWNRVRETDGTQVGTVAGRSGAAVEGGPAALGAVGALAGMVSDAEGNLYFAEEDYNRIRRISPAGILSTLAGTGDRGHSGDGGPAVEAELVRPQAVVLPGDGYLYFIEPAEWVLPGPGEAVVRIGGHVRRIDLQQGTIEIVAGSDEERDDPLREGPALDVEMDPASLAADGSGRLFFSTTHGNAGLIYALDLAAGTVTHVAGGAMSNIPGDGGPALDAAIGPVHSMAVGPDGALYLEDPKWCSIRAIDSAGIISTFAGTGTCRHDPCPIPDGTPATQAELGEIGGLAFGPGGDLYVGLDALVSTVSRITPGGHIHLVAGTPGMLGHAGDGGAPEDAQFADTRSIAFGPGGEVFIGDRASRQIRVIRDDAIFADSFD